MQLNRGTINGAAIHGRHARFHILAATWIVMRQGVQLLVSRLARIDLPFRASKPTVNAPQRQDSASARRG